MRISDWSSDVCSSDLPEEVALLPAPQRRLLLGDLAAPPDAGDRALDQLETGLRPQLLDVGQALDQVGVGLQDVADLPAGAEQQGQIGRASCRERVCQYV